jgi:hypothetical protein
MRLSETDRPFLYTYLNSLLRLSEYSRLNDLSYSIRQKMPGKPASQAFYAESTFLPLALLRFRTFRPDFVCILFRKPCSFLRCLFLGCNVIFMMLMSLFPILNRNRPLYRW